MLDLAERQLQEPLAESAERRRIAGGQEAVGALPVGVVLDSLARERLGNLARGLLRREDERDAAPEHALEDRADQRVVRAAEDDGVDPGGLQRLRVLAHSIRRLGAERLVALDQRYEARAGDREEADAGVERVDELGIPAGGDRRLRRHQADRRLRVVRTAAWASGVITPTTGTPSSSCSCGSAADVAALHAATTSLTPCVSRKCPSSRA